MTRAINRRQMITVAAGGALAAVLPAGSQAQGQPLRIGYSMSLTGPLASAGKSAHIATEIWRDEVNGNGGLLGRKVELVVLDDQSSAAAVPTIYAKLLDVDKVDLLLTGYATNQIAPAMPIAMQRRKLMLALHGLGNNEQFKYDRYFHVVPYGPNPKTNWLRGFADIANDISPKPQSIGFLFADAEFAQNSIDGLRQLARERNLRVAYDQSYPMSTVDLSAMVRSLRSADPDIVAVLTYPQQTVPFVRAVSELGLGPSAKLVGGGMVGPQLAAILQQLGPALNGFVNFHFYVPEPTVEVASTRAFLAKYQPIAAQQGVDPLGFYIPTFAYARLQVLQKAVEASKSLDEGALAQYIRGNSFDTVVGTVRFGPTGERSEAGAIFVQYQGVKAGDLEQFRSTGRQVIVGPKRLATGKLLTPFATARS